VTGVQTCALPIWFWPVSPRVLPASLRQSVRQAHCRTVQASPSARRRGGETGLNGGRMKGRSVALLEPVSKSFEENNEAGKLDKAEEIVGVVLPANEDPALPLNPGEEALDEPASHVAA